MATAEFPLAASLWAALWSGYGPFRKRPDDEFEPGEVLETAVSPGHFARDATLDFLKYRVRYRTAANGIGQTLTVVFGERHSGRFHFVESGVPGQGDVEYEIPITVSLAEVGLTGTLGSTLGSLVAIEGVDATLLYTVRFQPCVQTSERREGGPETETVVIAAGEPPRVAPSALCCVPDGDSRLDLAELTVRSGLTTGARNMTILVLALVAGGLTAVVMAALLPVLIIVTPVAALPTILSAGISVITATLAGAGLAALGTWLLEVLVVRPLVEDAIRSGVDGPIDARRVRRRRTGPTRRRRPGRGARRACHSPGAGGRSCGGRS